MNWRDPEGIWQHGVRTWRRMLLALVGTLLFGAALPIAVIWYLAPPMVNLPIWTLALLGAAGALMLGVTTLAVRLALQANALLKLVPDNAGRVCPTCRIAIAPSVSDETDESGDRLVCKRCSQEYTEPELQAHWRRYGVSPLERSRWMRNDSCIEDGMVQNAIRVRMMRRSLLHSVIWMSLIWSAFIGTNMLMWSGPFSGFHFLYNSLPYVLVMVAAVFVVFGWRAVEPHRRFCTACQYEREEAAGPICPECGSEWNDSGATTAGRMEARPAMFIAAGIVMAFMLAQIVSMFMGANLIASATPTNALINRLAASDDLRSMTLHQQLAARTLTAAQERRLIEVLLEKRRQNEFTIYDGQWLGDMHTAQSIPADLLDEFFREMVEIELRVPESVRVGEAIDVAIYTTDRYSVVGTQHPSVIVGGFFIGDDPKPRERQTIAKGWSLLGEECRVVGIEAIHRGQGPRLSIVAEEPGEVHVRLELWLFAMNRLQDTSFIIPWNDDGTPVLPERFEWMDHIVIERIVEVVEGP